MGKIIGKISDIFRKSLVRDSLWMMMSQGSSVIIQAAYFIIVARVLGSEDYGTFIGTTALVAAVFPFVGLGSSDIFIKHVARNPKVFRGYWGTALLTSLLFVFGLIPLTLLAARVFFPENVSLILVLLVLLADLLGLKMWELASVAFIAVDRVRLAAQAKILYSIGKLIAALVLLVFFKGSNVVTWGMLYCIGSIMPAVVSVLHVNRSFGTPIFNLRKYRPEFDEGFFFSIAASAETVNAQIDKTMLVSLASVDVAGIYGAGYRFIDVGYTLIFAVMSATYTRFLRHGATGIKDGIKFAKGLVPVACGYGILSAIALLSFAPFVSNLLGADYADSSNVLRWLAPIHLIAALQFIAADTLTGAGLQKMRSSMQVASAILNFSLNLYLIPQFSWYGAIWATLASETFKLVTLWGLVFFYNSKENRTGPLANGEKSLDVE